MKVGRQFIVGGIQVYRWLLSPMKMTLFGTLGRCRYAPACSAYAMEAVARHGVWHGSWLAGRRLCRCHPWGGAGYDPVPEQGTEGGPTCAPSVVLKDLSPRPKIMNSSVLTGAATVR
jgi:uncharacterized protein